MNLAAKERWGFVQLKGNASEKWIISIRTKQIKADFQQSPLIQLHYNRFYAQKIDYSITQHISNIMTGSMIITGNLEFDLEGYGYSEHNWGVQPKHLTAYWLHFWGSPFSGVIMDCRYDAGIPHRYTFIASPDTRFYLPGQVFFFIYSKILWNLL